MRPHPLLAITSVIFVFGAAATIGDAVINSPATRAGTHVRAFSIEPVAAEQPVPPQLVRRQTAILAGTYRTAPLPYLLASGTRRHHYHRRSEVIVFAVENRSSASTSQWLALRRCESNDNYSEDTGNGYYGAYQFAASTWWSLGYGGLPNTAAPAVQDAAAVRLQHRDGWSSWPVCSGVAGL